MFEERQPGILSPVTGQRTGLLEGHAPPPGPLVPAKYAALWGSVGLGLAVYAQAWAPQDLVGVCAAAASVALYAATGELPQPELLKRVGVLVPAALVPSLGLLATGVHTWAVDSHQPLLHILGTTLAVVTGTVRQPTVGLRNGATGRETLRLVPLLLLAGLAQGCVHKAASGPPAASLLADTTEPQPAPEQPPESPSTACKRLDDARLFWGVWSKVCGTLSGGAAAGTVATAGDPQKVVGISGLGLLACSVATGYLETELAVRHTAQCRPTGAFAPLMYAPELGHNENPTLVR